MKTDAQLKSDVLEKLSKEPAVSSLQIFVAAQNGIVTLSGAVPYYAEKHAAAMSTQKVGGVREIVEELEVSLAGIDQRLDTEIADTVAQVMAWHVWVPKQVQFVVENGWVTLTGIAKWEFQRKAATDCVRFLFGIKGVSNKITLKSSAEPTAVVEAIERVLQRDAEIDAEQIQVVANGGGKFTLVGKVETWDLRQDVELAAWSAPGVTAVENRILVC